MVARAVVALGVVCTVVAQESGGDFAALRQNFERERSSLLAPQLDRYIRKLAQLERVSVGQRNYALAAEIRAELDSAVGQWCEVMDARRDEIELKIADATVSDGAEALTDGAIGWGRKGGRVWWALPPGILAGAYAIVVECDVVGRPVEVVFDGGRHHLRRKLPVAKEGPDQQMEFRALVLEANATRFTVTLRGQNPGQGTLRRLTLKRLGEK